MKRETLLSTIQMANKATETGLRGTGHFVGVVYDTSSPNGDFPVALVVGINYGQITTSACVVGKEQDPIGYAKHVQKIAGNQNRPGNHHVVVWNFYPFLTDLEWLEEVSNCADEATRIFEKGYADPIEVFTNLVDKFQPDLIIFHGISSCVPVLARIAMRRIGRSGVLVPNLSRGLALSRLQVIT